METDFSNFCWFICTLFNLQASVEDKRITFAIVSADVSVLIHQEPTLSMSDHHHNDFRVFTGRWPPFDIDKAKRGTRPVTLLFMRASWAVIVWKYLTGCKFDAISSGSSIEAVFESVLHQNELSIIMFSRWKFIWGPALGDYGSYTLHEEHKRCLRKLILACTIHREWTVFLFKGKSTYKCKVVRIIGIGLPNRTLEDNKQ